MNRRKIKKQELKDIINKICEYQNKYISTNKKHTIISWFIFKWWNYKTNKYCNKINLDK